jgi:hypothetical protein
VRDRALVRRRARTLFVLDRGGAILRPNEPWGGDERLSPLVYAARGESIAICAIRHDAPHALLTRLRALLASRRTAPLGRDAGLEDALRDLAEADERGCVIRSGPAFRFPATTVEAPGCVVVTAGGTEPLRGDFDWALPQLDTALPFVVAVVDGRAVAVCRTVRRWGRLVEAGVETLEAYRHRGFGARVVATWCVRARDMGLEPLYSTSWGNAASMGLAARLGLVQYAVDYSLAEPSVPV